MFNESVLKIWKLLSMLIAVGVAIWATQDRAEESYYYSRYIITLRGIVIFLLTWFIMFSGLWIIIFIIWLFEQIIDLLLH